MAREMGMGVLPWSPLGGGVLSGKYSSKDLAGDSGDLGSRRAINVATGRLSPRNLAIADEVKSVAEELGRTPAQVALAWTLLNPAVASPVLGARTPAQLEDNLAALDIDLSETQLARLNEVSRIELGFPHDFLDSPMRSMMFGGVTVLKQ